MTIGRAGARPVDYRTGGRPPARRRRLPLGRAPARSTAAIITWTAVSLEITTRAGAHPPARRRRLSLGRAPARSTAVIITWTAIFTTRTISCLRSPKNEPIGSNQLVVNRTEPHLTVAFLTVSMIYRYCIDTIMIMYGYCIGTVSVRYRYDGNTISILL